MSRDLTSGMVSAFTAGTVRPRLLFEGVFRTEQINLWTGYGDLSWDSKTWLGNGWLTGISDIVENGEIEATSLDVILSGVPLALISLILTEQSHSSRGSLWVACMDSSDAVIADPYFLFDGALSAPRVDDSPEASQLVLTYEDDLVMLQRSSELRYTTETQQSIFSGDLGFEFVASLVNWTGFWGYKEKPKPATTSKKSNKKNKSSRR